MNERAWQAFWVNIVLPADRSLNLVLYIIPMPDGTRLGSGNWETLSRHWHREALRGHKWALRCCQFIMRHDPKHFDQYVRE